MRYQHYFIDWRLTVQDANQPFSIYRQVSLPFTPSLYIISHILRYLILLLLQILRLFTDSPSISSPYSVHNIVMKNKKMVRLNNSADYAENSTTNPFKAEPWFAPSAICRVLRYIFFFL